MSSVRPGNAALISAHAGRSGARVGGAQGLYGGEGGGFPVRVLQRDVGAAATEHLSGGKDGWSGRDLRFLFVKVPLTSSLDFFHSGIFLDRHRLMFPQQTEGKTVQSGTTLVAHNLLASCTFSGLFWKLSALPRG